MATVQTRTSTNNNSPHLSGKSMTASPRTTRTSAQNSDTSKKETSSTVETAQEPTIPSIKQPDEEASTNNTKDGASTTTNAPLAPPPKPIQNGDNDYFGGQHNQAHLTKEPNPFETAFGSSSSETPGKPQLPGVTSLTSPASLLPGNTPGWPGSLRSGPLSPAMLTGPTGGSNDYFNSDHHFSGSFPTPNESSLRTGLTPGGGGSMFPQPSPNSQALYNQLQSGGATPGTLDFHRTAMTARAAQSQNNFTLPQNGAKSQPTSNPNIQPDLDSKPYQGGNNTNQQQQENQDPFGSHQTTDAANGLFMLAQAGGQRNAQQQQQQQQYQQVQQQQAQQQQQHHQQQQQGYQQAAQQQDMHQRNQKGSVGSNMSGSTEAEGQYTDEDTKPQSKGKGKKGSTGKGAQNGKRKTEETPSKANKRQRANTEPEEDDDDMDDGQEQDTHPDGKKMTDEEKRKNFLERNRVAALKCRQRKKQWLANLQQKVEIFSTENDALAATVTQLREEIVGLKTLLLAHKDCPVSQAQGISSSMIQQIAGDNGQYANPYGMAMGPGGPGQGQMQGGMGRR
ncbi:Transcription factor [Saxophila tyrrhenica]|uniref:Transcription factor n=1 Tax=Saxophila tyrrhenica TaxID=1690608 RepID=A0AAV9P9P7_9PEZI|nr:Transcription factor [Saxophila tyrrhenica]